MKTNDNMSGHARRALMLPLCMVFLGSALAGAAMAAEASRERIMPSVPQVKKESTLGRKVLMYLPNRFLDLLDIVRLRGRVGPGFAANARVTIYAANFVGGYHGFYFGLPGPRQAPKLPALAGREELNGLIIMGIDATDKTLYPPGYTDSEVTLGAHAALIGLDVGLDPIELGDFLAGLIGRDVMGDDL